MIAKGIHESFRCSPLKPFAPGKFNRYQEQFPLMLIDEHSQKYDVEKIIDSKMIRKKNYFLVKWE